VGRSLGGSIEGKGSKGGRGASVISGGKGKMESRGNGADSA